MFASFRLEDLQQELANIEEQRADKEYSHSAANTNSAGSQRTEDKKELSSTIESANSDCISEFYSDQLGVGQTWETDRTVLPMEAWKEYDMPTPDWGKERSSHKPPPTNAINNVEKEGKCTFKALARWVTQQLIAGNGVIDSGATGHFLQQGIGIPTGQPSGKVVGMPNGQQERATKQVLLPIQGLNKQARLGDELPSLRHNSLLSVPKFADYGYTTIFKPGDEGVEVYNSSEVTIVPEAEPVLRGWRDQNGLWRTPLSPKPARQVSSADQINTITTSEIEGEIHAINFAQEHVNNIYHLPSMESRMAYIHASLGFPTKAAMLDAATAGRLIGIPFASTTNIRKHYPETKATPKGHLDQQRQGVRSTRANPKKPPSNEPRAKENDIYLEVWDLRDTTYSDQTGRFPYTSYKGSQYLMVLVEIDSSCILVEPLRDKTAEEMQRAYLHIQQRLNKAGVQPKKHVMDNEVSEILRETIENKCKLEMVPPGCHRRNVAEVAIKTFKGHFIAIIAGLPANFPLRLWDQLLPQAELTINILRPSHARPGVSAYTYLFGPFDFNRTPLAPLGCEVQCHVKPGDRGTWEEHTADGWYLGPSMDHYRSFHCYIKSTRSNRICDTVQFMHKYITNPALTKEDMVCKAAHDLIKALKGRRNKLGDEQEHDLKELSTIFQQIATHNAKSPSPPATSPVKQPENRQQTKTASEPRV